MLVSVAYQRPALMAGWPKVLLLTASYLLTIESRPGRVRKLPLTLG